MNVKKIIWFIVAILAIAAAVGGFLFYRSVNKPSSQEQTTSTQETQKQKTTEVKKDFGRSLTLSLLETSPLPSSSFT